MPGYTFVTFNDPLGTRQTAPTGINATGQIVGQYANNAIAVHSFIYSDGIFYTLPDDPAAAPGSTDANGLNASDQIVGSYNDGNSAIHGFLYSNGQFATIDDPLGGNGAAHGTVLEGINDAGQIVGGYSTSANVQHGFVYSHGIFT